MSSQDDEAPRDAWLRTALRHAPDADAAPPPKLEETILRMGRAAVAPREPHARPLPPPAAGGGDSRFASLWAWLSRPPVAAGFAVVFLSTVLGVMWLGRPVEDAMMPREETAASLPPEARPAAQAAAEREGEAAGLPEAARRAADTSTKVAIAPAEPPARKGGTPAAPAAVPPAPSAQATPAAPAAAKEAAARDATSAERREAAAARSPAAAAPASAAIETPSLSNLRFEIRRRPDAWTWQRDDGEARPMDDAMLDWIVQADRTARSSWQHGASAGAQVTTTLRFTRDGVVRAVLRLDPAGMQLTRGGKTESASLSRERMAALQSSLDALGP
jgi:hypothetical protein